MKKARRKTSLRDTICTGADLAKCLRKSSLTAKEARAWHKDLVAARRARKRQPDKWNA
jgi:hypothetical protein